MLKDGFVAMFFVALVIGIFSSVYVWSESVKPKKACRSGSVWQKHSDQQFWVNTDYACENIKKTK